MKTKFKILILTLAFVFAFGTVVPAKAFYIEVPQVLKDAINSIKTSRTSAQEGPVITTPTSDSIFCNALGRQTTKDECNTASGKQSGGTSIFCDALGRQTTKDECDTNNSKQQPQPNQPSQNNNQPNNNQINQQMMGKPPQNQFQQNNQPPMMNQGQGKNQGDQGGQGGQGNQNNQGDQGGKGMMPGGQGGQGNGENKNFLKDVQRGAKQLDRSLTQFDALVKSTEKAGGAVTSEMKDKADQLRKMVETAKTAQSADDLQDFDMGEAGGIAQDLEQYRRDIQEQTQRLKQVKQQIRNAEQAVKSFEKQIIKAKDCVSPELKTKIETLKNTINTIKTATTWNDVESAGLDDMGDLFDGLNDSREQMEICARWPQILKQVDKQMKDLGKQVIKSKALVAKLSAKGVDLSVPFNAFEDGVNKMKAVREEAVNKMKSGDVQGASDLLENDLFGQMDDVMQNQQTIQVMSNLGSFNAQFKKETASAQKQINTLKRKKIDTSELESVLAEVKTKGSGILASIKQKDMDLDTIMSEMNDMQDLRSEFSDKISELTGEDNGGISDILGPSQFKSIQMPTGMNQYITQKAIIDPAFLPVEKQTQPQQQTEVKTDSGSNF